uniref:Gustatory receptor n=1 Tax=Strigamia maritima TaxID=126957 RepID=T1JJX3_STRMM
MAEKPKIIDPVENLGLRFINRVWRVLFGVFGIQLDMLGIEHYSKCWKKIIFAVFIRVLHAVNILHYIVVIVYYKLHYSEHFFGLVSMTYIQVIAFFTAILCLKNEKKIAAAYRKIVFNLSSAEDLLKTFDRHTKLYFFVLIATTVAITANQIAKEIVNDHYHQICRKAHAQMGIHNNYLSNITALIDYCEIIVFSYWFTDVIFVYFAHLCKGLALNFVLVNRCLEAELRATSLTSSKLNVLRHKYEYISGLVDEISELFSPLILFWISLLVLNLCFDIRALQLSSATGVFFSYSRYIVQIFRSTIFLFLILKVASQINTQAHLMKRKLFTKVMDESRDRDTSKVTFYTNYQLFSDSINSFNVGISVSGLFTITVTSCINIVGTILTYTIVLYQTA